MSATRLASLMRPLDIMVRGLAVSKSRAVTSRLALFEYRISSTLPIFAERRYREASEKHYSVVFEAEYIRNGSSFRHRDGLGGSSFAPCVKAITL